MARRHALAYWNSSPTWKRCVSSSRRSKCGRTWQYNILEILCEWEDKLLFYDGFIQLFFQSIFKNPSIALSGILALQIFLVLFQLALLVRCTYWYHIVSLTLLLFFNYYTLFKIGRDYLISLKIYRTEQIMHEKIVLH